MGEFVIHQHQTPDDVHWDFMLKMGDRLLTWRIPISPETIGDQSIEVEQSFDHPLRFLTYEGPVQNKTGTVQIVDRGGYTLIRRGKNQYHFELAGSILHGRFDLLYYEQRWILQKRKG